MSNIPFTRRTLQREIRMFISLLEILFRRVTWVDSISYPESSGFLVSGATPGRLWGHRKNSIFLIGCSVMVSIVLPQKSCGNKIRCLQSLPGVAPLTKKPEDSGHEIGVDCKQPNNRSRIRTYTPGIEHV